MSDNLIPVSPSHGDSGPDAKVPTGRRLRLSSLAPQYSPEDHSIYADLLQRAISHPDTRNVALTGAYGTGKSSVLKRLMESEEYSDRIVTLSLSTIGPDTEHDNESDNPEGSPTSRVNRIQKEIVKQLLYGTAVDDVPQSRYRRASVPNQQRAWWAAAAIGLPASLVLIALGVFDRWVTDSFLGVGRQILAYTVGTALAVGLAWLVVTLVRSRPRISASVNASVTTVTLTEQSDTYFDAYLDEIVYYFEATRRDIVILEDIDRFEDAQIFDTLRALNALLNSSGQIKRRVVFVYAIRDSVFENLGEPLSEVPQEDSLDQAKEVMKRANRTKFFDVIVPVVPFVTPDNARDVMTRAMKSDAFQISPSLIRLAARHVADMRLIRNIRNEFEVYRDRLIKTEDALPDISDDLVFAIVIFKNTHLADYERIRHRDSSLDRLFVVWRDFVAASARDVRRRIALHDEEQEVAEGASQRLARIRTKILGLQSELDSAAPRGYAVRMDEEDAALLDSTEGWAQIVQKDALSLTLTTGSGKTNFAFSTAALERVVGESVDPAKWAVTDASTAAGDLQQLQDSASFLRHHTWSSLYERGDIEVDKARLDLTPAELKRLSRESPAETVSFRSLTNALLTSALSRDLVRGGFLTSHFALYTSMYYGEHLGPQAREYIYRCIGPGVPDMSYPMKPLDVDQILREQDATLNDDAEFFSDPSVLNISIVDYLLSSREGAARTVVRQVARLESVHHEFIDAYAQDGLHLSQFLDLLTPLWSGALIFAATSPHHVKDTRATLLHTVLTSMEPDHQDVDENVGPAVERHYKEIEAITAPASAERALVVMETLARARVSLPDVAPLNDVARNAAVQLQVMPVTEANLRALIPRGRIILADLHGRTPVYHLILGQLNDFLALVRNKPKAFGLAASTSALTVLVLEAPHLTDQLLRQMLDLTPAAEPLGKITDVPVAVWEVYADLRRAKPSFSNVLAYIEEWGPDESLANLLQSRRIVDFETAEEGERKRLAYELLSAEDHFPSTFARVQTVSSFEPGLLEASNLPSESGDLVARLLKAKLIADDPAAFSEQLLGNWAAMEKAIKASTSFASFVTPAVLPVRWVSSFLDSRGISISTKRAVLKQLREFLASGSRRDALEIARSLARNRWQLQRVNISALAEAGASSGTIVELIRLKGDGISLEETRQVLVLLGGDYVRVAQGGKKGAPHFSNDDAHRELLNRFLGDTISSYRPQTFRRIGERLVAQTQ